MNFLKICSKLKPWPQINLIKPKFFKFFSQKILDVNTNIVKDVILYKSDNDKFFKAVNLFGIAQFGFWNYLGLTAYQTLKDIPVSQDQSTQFAWWQKINFGESKWRNSLTIFSFFIGWSILSVTWIYTLRAIKYLILRKGGKEVTIVTYGPFGKNRMFTLNVNNISAKQARTGSISFLPLKLKDHKFHYMIDMKGEFRNPVLFDNTVGLKRAWNY